MTHCLQLGTVLFSDRWLGSVAGILNDEAFFSPQGIAN